MKSAKLFHFWFVACIFAVPSVQAELLTNGVIKGDRLPPRTIVLTYDDGPDEEGEILRLAEFLYEQNISATFFLGGCHFINQPLPDPRSSLCTGYGTKPEILVPLLVLLGHGVGNHTQDHLSLPDLSDEEIIYQLGQTQKILDPFQFGGFHPFRAPGLSLDRRVAEAVNATPLKKLVGPFDVDVGGYFEANGGMGGDWDCYNRDYSPEACGDIYVGDIIRKSQSHGVIMLLHNRTEVMMGSDYALKITRYILKRLGPDYKFVPLLDAVPGL